MLTTRLHRAEVENEWSLTSTPLIRPNGVDEDKFAFTFHFIFT